MGLRQEQVVLAATAVLLGVFLWRGSSSPSLRNPRGSSGEGPRFEERLAPEVARSLSTQRPSAQALPRDLFAPPRDTVPLPPLELAPPPLPALTALKPPGVPGPAARHFGALLRASAEPKAAPGLFVADEAEIESDAAVDDALDDGSEVLATLSQKQSEPAPSSPDERAAQLASWKKLYDWVRVDSGEPMFGRIGNADRFALAGRSKEPLEFKQVDPRTGAEKFPGMAPVKLERERVLEFALADTPSNSIQLQRREFLSNMSPGRYPDLLAFADRCVSLRLEARESLSVAEEMYKLAAEHAQDDPAPRLGLARCHEAAFQLEAAFEDYLALIQDFGHRAEVHVGLAQLEARVRLFESAEERLRQAERIDRLSWRVQWPFGRFLLDRGRVDEALAHLEIAYQGEPGDPQATGTRAGIRNDLGRAQLAAGRVQDAAGSFERALQAEPGNAGARAGALACARLLKRSSGAQESSSIEQASFELLMGAGLAAIDAGQAQSARDLLEQAAQTDPLQAGSAFGALAWLAETSGYPEEAFRLIEEAHASDPQDAWVLYERGRLLAARDDVEGAQAAFVAALDRELDFPDALIALAALTRRAGDLRSADLYLERALQIDPSRPEIHALRGIGLLELGDVGAAEVELEAAQKLDPQDPVSACGLAWAAYRRGESERAVRLFAELDDRRRALPESDPYRTFAREQIKRLQDHESKQVWSDRFERRELRNDWQVEERAGPIVAIENGELCIRGEFRESGQTRVLRDYAAPDFVAVELSLRVAADNNAQVGLFLAKERRRGANESEIQGIIAIARRKDGGLIVRTEDRVGAEPLWEDVEPIEGSPWWPVGRAVRLRIERSGEGSEAKGRVLVDGIAVRDGFPMRSLSGSTNDLRVGVFVEGQVGLPASVAIDDVQVVRKVAQPK
jgi:Tfp pilus assembly protein PilF